MQGINSKMQPNLSNTVAQPVAQSNGNNLVIKIPAHFRDEGWANGMGGIQTEISQWVQQETATAGKVIFDFRNCRWIDPLPLMSILIELANVKHRAMSAEALFPKIDSGPHSSEIGPYQKSPNRLLNFLSQEGFFDELDKLGVTYSGNNREIYRTLHVIPSYEDARCIPLSLFEVPSDTEPNWDFAMKSVEDILKGADTRLESKVSPHARERLIYKLRVVLQEMLHNAQEHAFDEDNPRLMAIYVRFRIGGFGLDSAGRQIFLKHANEENTCCPMLTADWLVPRPGCLEVFVLDRGIGMVRSFEKAGTELKSKYKFNEVMRETFVEGKSRKPERLTLYGGLHLLHNLLSETGDYIRAFEAGVWFGSAVPLFRATAPTHKLAAEQTHMQGFAMHFRLGWKRDTDYGDKWVKFKQGSESEIWPELSLSENDCTASFNWFEGQKVFDERIGELREYGDNNDWILWLVRPHRMKWDIINFIEYTIVPSVSKSTTLIIADIPSYEAATYEAALSEFKALGKEDWPHKFLHIVISTNRWSFATIDYQKHGQRHGFSSLRDNFKEFPLKLPPIMPKPKNFRLAIVRWIKWHDSRRLWEEVSQGKSMYVPEQIAWGYDKGGKSINIAGYLDFPQTTHSMLCAAIYKITLARVLGVLPLNDIELFTLDRLTMSVLREIHATEVYEQHQSKHKLRLALGSVLVSGTTLYASASPPFDLHFFVHFSSPLRGNKAALLFWLPKEIVSSTEPRLARIGKTASIAPEGWKSFEVPRYDNNGECIGGRDPEKTYQDWQSPSPVIIKAGHWSYEGQHDFLTINIEAAVEAAFLEKNELARFLVNHVLPFIGVDKEHIDKNWHRLFDASKCNQANYGLLVYRSHPCTESVIYKLLEILTPDGRKIASSRIYPILPIRTRWGGSTLLIAPLVREEIRNALHQMDDQARKILLFDDAAITGRTLHDLRAILSDIGATQIDTVVIANRLRNPANGCGAEKINYYWRLDVPVMGRDGNCPFCHALYLADKFTSSLSSRNAKDKIMNLKQNWTEISPLANWSSGLRPIPLKETERKKFCYRLNKKEAAEDERYFSHVDLIRSTGMSIFISELHAMSGRDDYCLKKINECDIPEIRVELAAGQLFLFGDEYDIDIRVELIKTLIKDLALLKEDSQHAPLAFMAIIDGLRQIDKSAKIKIVESIINDDWTSQDNYIAKILLAYLVSEEIITDKTSEAYKIGMRLLTTSSFSLAQKFNACFLETLSPLGNAHSEAIPVLIDELKEMPDIKDERIADALDSLDHLENIFDGFERDFVRKDASGAFGDKTNLMKQTANVARDYLNQKYQRVNNWRDNTKSALENYIIAMKSVADAYFHRIPSTHTYFQERTFETKALEPLINDIDWLGASKEKNRDGNPVEPRKRSVAISITSVSGFDSKAEEVWIAWHRRIDGIVRDLLRNAVYASHEITDPWDTMNEKKADLWVRVDYGKEYVELILANAASNDSSSVYSKFKKHRWVPLLELGGTIEAVDVKNGVIGIKIRIPYAGYLQDRR